MYRLKKSPPEMPLNNYIVEYKRTGDEQFLAYFLHRYEYSLNIRAEDFCGHYGRLQHFQDVKQTIVAAMFAKIGDYDPTVGTTLVQYTKWYVEEAVIDYIRQIGEVAINESAYDTLRKITAIYYENPEATEAERYRAIKEQFGYDEKKTREFLRYGELFRYSTSLDAVERDEDEGRIPLIERLGDIYQNPEYIVLKKLFCEAVAAVVDGLSYRDKRLFLNYIGLKRISDGFVDSDPLPKAIIAAHSHIGSIEAVNERFKRVARQIKDELEKQGWIEGENTPKLSESAEKEDDLTDIDRDVVDYAVRKWQASGDYAAIHVLHRDEWVENEKLVREFLKLWLY
jgi:DNA-directed RNA polymerase specialized sigma subunit